MTALEVARLLHARKTSKGKWQASCPAHGRDKHPSLSITEGKSAVLLKCWSHDCTPKSICEALGLTVSDLFYESRPRAPAHLKRMEAQRKADERKEVAEKAKKRRLIEQANYWRAEVQRLGKLLAEQPDSDKIARQFHWAVDRQRTAQAAIRPYFHKAFIGDADL